MHLKRQRVDAFGEDEARSEGVRDADGEIAGRRATLAFWVASPSLILQKLRSLTKSKPLGDVPRATRHVG